MRRRIVLVLRSAPPRPCGWLVRGAALALAVLMYAGALLFAPTLTLAQGAALPPGSIVKVANTDGQPLNLRAGPSVDQPIVRELAEGDLLTVTGPGQLAGTTRWLPVRTAGGQNGWVSAQYVAVVSTPTPPTLPTRTPTPDGAASAAPAASQQQAAEPTPTPGPPVDVEAKLKFPETSGREQEITVWVTRAGTPVVGAIVTVESTDGDLDAEERIRVLDPTNEEGRARRSFDIRKEKGTVELKVSAVAPDGGQGRTEVAYFRR